MKSSDSLNATSVKSIKEEGYLSLTRVPIENLHLNEIFEPKTIDY